MSADGRMAEVPVLRFEHGGLAEAPDLLAVESPLEIRLRYRLHGRAIDRPISVTMRTPGEDAELAVGFLVGEGLLRSPADLVNVQVSVEESSWAAVELRHGAEVEIERLQRNFYATSSCGVCGRASLEAVDQQLRQAPATPPLAVTPELLLALPERLRARQSVFASTGGLHAAALFSPTGDCLGISEDVGRHNALDKLIGAQFLAGRLPLANAILLLSGRASFELLQKAVMAGIPVVAAVGAPSSLAVDLARRFGRTLIGFLRDHRYNLYTTSD